MLVYANVSLKKECIFPKLLQRKWKCNLPGVRIYYRTALLDCFSFSKIHPMNLWLGIVHSSLSIITLLKSLMTLLTIKTDRDDKMSNQGDV